MSNVLQGRRASLFSRLQQRTYRGSMHDQRLREVYTVSKNNRYQRRSSPPPEIYSNEWNYKAYILCRNKVECTFTTHDGVTFPCYVTGYRIDGAGVIVWTLNIPPHKPSPKADESSCLTNYGQSTLFGGCGADATYSSTREQAKPS